jgi:hypothetical protein
VGTAVGRTGRLGGGVGASERDPGGDPDADPVAAADGDTVATPVGDPGTSRAVVTAVVEGDAGTGAGRLGLPVGTGETLPTGTTATGPAAPTSRPAESIANQATAATTVTASSQARTAAHARTTRIGHLPQRLGHPGATASGRAR